MISCNESLFFVLSKRFSQCVSQAIHTGEEIAVYNAPEGDKTHIQSYRDTWRCNATRFLRSERVKLRTISLPRQQHEGFSEDASVHAFDTKFPSWKSVGFNTILPPPRHALGDRATKHKMCFANTNRNTFYQIANVLHMRQHCHTLLRLLVLLKPVRWSTNAALL